MVTLQNIRDIASESDQAVALDKLQAVIDQLSLDMNSNTSGEALLAAAYAEKGKILWRAGDKAGAISAYEASAQEDPDGPGALLLEHSRGIMDFFDPNQLNP
ncbi:MAG: hypothetical protein K2O10_00750 [Muribaculaceae bacterium]|nr:hypothetical protein [Muribaculaceae bacterium]